MSEPSAVRDLSNAFRHGGAVRVLLARELEIYGVWFALAVLVLISTLVSPEFLHTTNLLNILRQSVPLAIVAMGEALVILVGGFDVSVGNLVTLTAVITARVMAGNNARILPTVLLVLGIGAVVGLTNGLLVAKLRTDSFVTTLAMMLVLQGAALVYTQGSPANDLTHGFRQISVGDIGGIPISVLCFPGIFAVVWFVLNRTVPGRRLYAVGTNRRVTHLSGQPLTRTIVSAYVACSVLTVVGGLFLVAWIGTTDMSAGSGWALQAIAAALIGGAAIGGGRGGVGGPVGGVLVLTTILNLVDLLALPNYAKLLVEGGAIITGVALYSQRRSS